MATLNVSEGSGQATLRPFFASSSSDDHLVSNGAMRIFQWVVCTGVTLSLCIFGTVTNIVNIFCFIKQGLADSANVNFLGLAISDLGSVTTFILCCTFYTPSFQDLDLPFEPWEFQYLIGATTHVIFSRVTCWITALITVERCLCITMPLKVKSIITAKRTMIIIVSFFILSLASSSPVYCVSRLGWSFSPQRNKTVLRLQFTPDRLLVEGVSFIVNNLFLPFVAFLIILFCTGTLVITLRKKQQWRKEVSVSESVQSATKRDTKVARMVVVISTLFIVCYVPICILFCAMSLIPELSVTGKYINLVSINGFLGVVLESTNSSTNLIIYYRMSSKYKAAFYQLFRLKS